MATNDNLTDFLTDVADAIRSAKGTAEKINPQMFSPLILTLANSGKQGIDWSVLGYNEPEQVELAESPLVAGFNYALEVLNNWDNTISNGYQKHYQDANMVYFPLVDTGNITNFISLLNRCSNMLVCADIDTSNGLTFGYMFAVCSSLKVGPRLDLSKATAVNDMYSECSSLVRVPEYDTSKAANLKGMFYNCANLLRVEGIDYSSVDTAADAWYNCTSLRYLLIKNFGKAAPTLYYFSTLTNWGIDSAEVSDAKQSLVGTFITYSYDRVAAGLGSVTVTLSANTKAALTEAEIAQMTAKGITIA